MEKSAIQKCVCGICKYSEDADAHRCFICLRFRCKGDQHRLSMLNSCTVCSECINANFNDLNKIFVDGKNEKGEWIDPLKKIAIKTCICGMPWSGPCGLRQISAISQRQIPSHRPI